MILYSLSNVTDIVKDTKPTHLVLVISSILKKKLAWAIQEIKNGIDSPISIIIIPDSENAKNWQTLESLLNAFLKHKLDRKSLVIGLGGGTVGDLVGFAASIYLRGISYINIPTTLLSQVDSAHGGKTGINFNLYKNQIGCFYNPIATIIDERFISSLNDEQITEGLGEIIKYGLIKDKKILDLLQNEKVSSLKNSSKLGEIIKRSIKVKLAYIQKDPFDKGLRQLLNVGHTIGHAIELKYKLGHGKAILIGTLKELYVTEKLGLTKLHTANEVRNLYEKLGCFDNEIYKADWNAVMKDKKIQGSKIELPVVIKIGKSEIIQMEVEKLRNLFI